MAFVIDKSIWEKERRNCISGNVDQDVELQIYASDIDPEAVELARENAYEAGVDDCIDFSVCDFKNAKVKGDYGVVDIQSPIW